MTSLRARLVAGMVALLGVSARAQAQEPVGGLEAGPFGGASLRASPVDDAPVERSLTLGLRGGLPAWRGVRLDGELAYSPSDTDAAGADAMVFGVRAHAVWRFDRARIVAPFVALGIGATVASIATTERTTDADFLLSGGVGALLRASPHFALRIDVRGLVTPLGRDGYQPGGVEALVGFTTSFDGPKPTTTRATVIASAPPSAPPPSASVPVSASVPDLPPSPTPNRPQASDLRPRDPEPEARGLRPDVSSPPPPEPTRDYDGDHLVGAADECPAHPETANSWQDTDGCPDEVPAELARGLASVETLAFGRKRSILSPRAAKPLDAVARALAAFPNARVRVVVSSRELPNQEDDVKLSTRRAIIVRAELVARGVAADRVVFEGRALPQRAKKPRVELRLESR